MAAVEMTRPPAPAPELAVVEPLRPGLALDHEHGRSLRVRHGEVELLRYVYAPWEPQFESPRPYLHPVRTLDGDLVSAYRPHDHVWHKGISWSLPVVGDDNFWGGPSYVAGHGYVALPNNGAMRHRRFEHLAARPDRVDLAQELDWIAEDGTPRFAERRALAVTLAPDAWLLTFDTAMTNVADGPIALGSPTTRGRPAAGYGGLFWRGPRAFTGGVAHAPGLTGGDDLMGTRHPWLAFTGQHDENGRQATVLYVDAPDNPGHPTRWFVRTTEFPGLSPAPFYSEEVVVEPGETLRLRYAVAVAGGARTQQGLAALAGAGLAALEAPPRRTPVR